MPPFPPNTPAILYVDDEAQSLKYFEQLFEDLGPILTATNAADGYALFEEHADHIGLILSDQRMPGEQGTEFLARVRQANDRPIRVLVTAHTDYQTGVEALNDGLIYSYLTKPWDPEELEQEMQRLLDLFTLRRERDKLLQEKVSAVEQIVMADRAASMGILSSGLNHHMRNALTAVRTFLDLLPGKLEEETGAAGPGDTSFWTDYYGEVQEQMGRMTQILKTLWEASHREELTTSPNIRFASVIAEAAEMLREDAHAKSVVVTIHDTPDLPTLQADQDRLAHASRLLLQEGITNVESGGSIEVRIESTVYEGAPALRAEFIDSGKPIADTDLRRLFDPFFVRSQRPDELGTHLMACYLTAYHHGGTISARRLEDDRNAIALTLPLVPNPPSPEETPLDRLGRLAA